MPDDYQISPPADRLRDPDWSLRREWLVVNGLGGFAMGSLAGANTRRYHGLLVAALKPPVGRAVLLSKLEETLELTGAGNLADTYPLSCNVYPGVLHPQGYSVLESWTAYPVPAWVWSPAPGVRVEKRVWMAQGRNTTYISYRLLDAPEGHLARLALVPLLAWKDFHSEMHANEAHVGGEWDFARTSLRLTLPGVWGITDRPVPLTLSLLRDDGKPVTGTDFHSGSCWYYRFQHSREAERGLDAEEDLFSPGTFSVPLEVGKAVTVVATIEETAPEPPAVSWKALRLRHRDLIRRAGAKDAFAKQLTLAADAFIVQVPSGRSTVIAGYPWFSDWGRDTMIALPGLTLATGRPEIAKEILLSFAQFVDRGMIPNRFPDGGETPDYNTADATLWYVHAVGEYVSATGDLDTLRELWPALTEIIRCHREGTRYGIGMDFDGLLHAGEPGTQLTWMDAKVGDTVFTPRIGKPVEINALWVNALRWMQVFLQRLGKSAPHVEGFSAALLVAGDLRGKFLRPDGVGLYDVADTPTGGPDASIRPNQIFAVSLPHAEVGNDANSAVVKTVHEHLFTDYGLRTLSPDDAQYRPRYEGGPWERDSAYHQGTVWPWPLGAFAEAYYRVTGDRDGALALLEPMRDRLTDACMGSISEVYDADSPHRPNGCPAQAWSVAETLRVWKWLQNQKKRSG